MRKKFEPEFTISTMLIRCQLVPIGRVTAHSTEFHRNLEAAVKQTLW